MKGEQQIIRKTIGCALSGKGAHVLAKNVFEGLDWKLAGKRPEGAPHSLFQLLNHLIYWQNWVVDWLDGKEPPLPTKAPSSWPGDSSPASAEEWQQTVKAFAKGLDAMNLRTRKADPLAEPGKGIRKSRLEMLHTIASHNSYHLGQAVLLRRMLGTWPPPSGGLTW